MKPHIEHITARVEDGVSITLPRLRVDITEAQAKRLRDVLNSVLPPANTGKVARTLRLLHLWGDVDPEISGPYDSDEDRLAAAQDFRRAHGEGNGVFKLDVTGDVEADVRIESYTGGDLEMPKKPSKWVSSAWIEGRNALVVPTKDGQRFEMHAFETHERDAELLTKATFEHHGRAFFAGDTWTRTGKLDLTEAIRERTPVHVGDDVFDPSINEWRRVKAVTGLSVIFDDDCTMGIRAAQEAEKRPRSNVPPSGCTLCRCTATGEAFGFPVCDYHADHTEDDPRCPHCVAKHTCERCENRNAEHIVTDVALCERCSDVVRSVRIGDRVRDPLDGTWREIVGIDGLADGGTCHMADGGCMSLDECAAAEKRLPSEELPS